MMVTEAKNKSSTNTTYYGQME